jgi:hypothetical protein
MPEPAQTHPIDYEAQPQRYPVEMDDTAALTIAPYSERLLPYWRYGSKAEAALSAAQLYEHYTQYKEKGDFVGMDVARRLLRLGMRHAREAETPQLFQPGGPMEPTAAAIFSKTFRMVDNDPEYAVMREAHAAQSTQ